MSTNLLEHLSNERECVSLRMEISRPSKKKLENLGHGAGNIYYATSSNTTIDSDNYDGRSGCKQHRLCFHKRQLCDPSNHKLIGKVKLQSREQWKY
jgi:hypothetical protein